MRPGWLAGALALMLYVGVRRRAHGNVTLAFGALAAAGALLIGLGVVELPNVEHLIEDAGKARSSRPARSSGSSRPGRRR